MLILYIDFQHYHTIHSDCVVDIYIFGTDGLSVTVYKCENHLFYLNVYR